MEKIKTKIFQYPYPIFVETTAQKAEFSTVDELMSLDYIKRWPKIKHGIPFWRFSQFKGKEQSMLLVAEYQNGQLPTT